MGQLDDLEGEGLRIGGMDAQTCREALGYGASGGTTAINQQVGWDVGEE